jgi:hypothetical protein
VTFLPAFFIALTIALVMAVALRLHFYRPKEEGGRATMPRSASNVIPQPRRDPEASPRSIPPSSAASVGESERARLYRELLELPLLPTHSAETKAPVLPRDERRSAFSSAPPSVVSRTVVAAPNQTASAVAFARTQPSAASGPAALVNDPNSDVTAPVLGSITFDPPVIHDGESTTVTVTAKDDNSGVRVISGSVISPSGGLLGFATQRVAEEDQFVARVAIPLAAADGMWRVNYLSLQDNAGNSVTLSDSHGMLPPSAAFRVQSSRSDVTAPKLIAIWLDRPQVRAGEHDTVFVQAEDDKSGVSSISGVFISPSSGARIGFGCQQQENSETWLCDVAPAADVACGDWKLEQVHLQDKANNPLVVTASDSRLAALRLLVTSAGCDSNPPEVLSVAVDPQVTTAPAKINIVVRATDDNSGIAGLSGHFVYTGAVAPGSQPPRLYFSCVAREAASDMFEGVVAIPNKAAKGLWRIGALDVIDKAGNPRHYLPGDLVMMNAIFRVQ